MEWEEESEGDELKDNTRRYLPSTVIWTTDWTTGALLEQMRRGIFDVTPPFQRRSAWDGVKASKYIESLILGCPVPAITLAEVEPTPEDSRQYIVIDGKQRLGALKQFAIDESLKLQGLDTFTELNGQSFREVAELKEFARFENLPIRTVVLRNWQKTEVLQFVFHRLNSQVTPLSTHELRRALLAGPFTTYLDEKSAQSLGLQRILNIREPDYRLRDAELLLRAIALCGFFGRYKGSLKAFLDGATRTLNKRWTTKTLASVNSICEEIEAAIQVTFKIFGDGAFQRYDEGQPVGRFNRAVFDLMIMSFRHALVRQQASLRPTEVLETFKNLMGNEEFNGWTEATTKSKEALVGRVARWAEELGNTLGISDLPKLAQRSDLLHTGQ